MDEAVCRNCGAALPRVALVCPRCGNPVFLLAGRRSRQRRDAAMVGMAGSLLMCAQSAFMLAGGSFALAALAMATRGNVAAAYSTAGTAAILVGFTLLFDLVGVLLLVLSFHRYTRAVTAGATMASADPQRRAFVLHGRVASALLALWLLVTVAWRAALASLVSFYPTPFARIEGVSLAEVQRAASIMLALWVAAAFLLFLGAVFGTRFLLRARGVPLTFPRLLWPLETLVHFCAAAVVFVVAPGLLAGPNLLELSSLAIVQTLGAIELLVVPVLGLLAYASLFLEFSRLHRAAQDVRVAASAAVPTDPPAGEP